MLFIHLVTMVKNYLVFKENFQTDEIVAPNSDRLRYGLGVNIFFLNIALCIIVDFFGKTESPFVLIAVQ